MKISLSRAAAALTCLATVSLPAQANDDTRTIGPASRFLDCRAGDGASPLRWRVELLA